MDQQTFRQAILLLSGENSVAILRALRDGGWHLSSEVARSLHIHITTASKFLQRFADLGLVDRRPHDARTFEYRLRSPHLRLEVDFEDDGGPLREVIDFYVAYFHSLFERIRYVGTPAIEIEMEHRLTTDHQELRQAVFDQMIDGSEAGLDRLRELVAAVHRDLCSVCAQGLGAGTAKGVFQAALRDAIGAHPDLALRCGKTSRVRGWQRTQGPATAADLPVPCPMCEVPVALDATTCQNCGAQFASPPTLEDELDDLGHAAVQDMVQEELQAGMAAPPGESPGPPTPSEGTEPAERKKKRAYGKRATTVASQEGLTNGLVLQRRRGRKSGMTNGLANDRGRTNGLTNGVGRTNGLTNGLGRTNGLTNGVGRTNGITNGLGGVRPAGFHA